MKTLQVGGLSSSAGRFGSDCITLFLYKLWCLRSASEVRHLDGGLGQRSARASREMMMWTLGCQRVATGGRNDVSKPWETSGSSLEMKKCIGLGDPPFSAHKALPCYLK